MYFGNYLHSMSNTARMKKGNYDCIKPLIDTGVSYAEIAHLKWPDASL